MVALAGRRLGANDRIEVRDAWVHALPFEDDLFAAATARLVFQHLPDPAAALTELRRVLRPGGRLFITDIDGDWAPAASFRSRRTSARSRRRSIGSAANAAAT
jgi:ubiquinone/menaquinone biosynthesis C-methylase UbiE